MQVFCTTIDIDFKHEKITIQNYTQLPAPQQAKALPANPNLIEIE